MRKNQSRGQSSSSEKCSEAEQSLEGLEDLQARKRVGYNEARALVPLLTENKGAQYLSTCTLRRGSLAWGLFFPFSNCNLN